MSKQKLILYGANGYTGKLILEQFQKQNLPGPLLVGRNQAAISKLADENNLDFEISTAVDIEKVLKRYKEVVLLVNAAGPFVETAKPIAEACIRFGVHYIDVTGEITVFQQLLNLNKKAKEKGVMILPGAGFDVVPTDCMAVNLKEEMPEAKSITLAFAGLGGGLSRGTARTAIKQMGNKTWVREQGELKQISWNSSPLQIDFGHFKGTCLPIPWGDLQTAWVSTHVPNIRVYIPFSTKIRKWISMGTKLAQVGIIKRLLLWYVGSKITGPTSAQREKAQTHIIGIAKNEVGKHVRKHLVTPDGYTFTALSVAEMTKRILKGKYSIGYQTPAMAYGSQFVESINGVSWLSR